MNVKLTTEDLSKPNDFLMQLAKRRNCAKFGEPINEVRNMLLKELEVFHEQVKYFNEENLAKLCEQRIFEMIDDYSHEIKEDAPQMPQGQAQQVPQLPQAKVQLVVPIPKKLLKKILKIRRTDHIVDNHIYEANKIIPAEDQLSYEVYLVGFQHVVPCKNGWYTHGFNFLFSNGTGTKYPPYEASPSDWSTVPLQDHHKDQVRTIRVHTGNCSIVWMIELFGLDGTLLLRAGDKKGKVVKDFELQQGERIIGVQGWGSFGGDEDAWIRDIQFVIGRLE
jgi:hypothetical protein